jgi:transposase
MLTPSGHYRIFAHATALDFRCGMDRIAYICKAQLAMNPYGGAVFLFFNKSRDRAKIFFHDGSGPCLFLKRLDRGRFQLPRALPGVAHAEVAASELALLLEGIDIAKIARPKAPPRNSKQRSKTKTSQALANVELHAP